MNETNELNFWIDDLSGKLALATQAPPASSDDEDNTCVNCYKFRQALNSSELLI